MVYFITFHVIPEKKNSDYSKIKGAYINCWIESEGLEPAKMIATKTIKELKWEIVGLEAAYEITLSDYEYKPHGKEFYEQALIDKEVYSIHQYSN